MTDTERMAIIRHHVGRLRRSREFIDPPVSPEGMFALRSLSVAQASPCQRELVHALSKSDVEQQAEVEVQSTEQRLIALSPSPKDEFSKGR